MVWLGYRRLYRKAFYFTVLLLAAHLAADMIVFWLGNPEGNTGFGRLVVSVLMASYLSSMANGWYRERANEASTAGKWELSGRSWVGAIICPIVSLFGFVVIAIGFYVMLEAFGIPTPMPAE